MNLCPAPEAFETKREISFPSLLQKAKAGAVKRHNVRLHQLTKIPLSNGDL